MAIFKFQLVAPIGTPKAVNNLFDLREGVDP